MIGLGDERRSGAARTYARSSQTLDLVAADAFLSRCAPAVLGRQSELTALSVLNAIGGACADPGVSYGGLTGARKQGKPLVPEIC
jgi:hypothetical protein